MYEQTQLVLYPSVDRQPMEFDGGVRDVVSRSKATHEPRGSVSDPLQRCDGGVRQTGEQSVAVVESCQHERCHDDGGDVTTEQTPNLTQTSQLEEASLRHLGHMCLHTQTAVEVHASEPNAGDHDFPLTGSNFGNLTAFRAFFSHIFTACAQERPFMNFRLKF